MRLIAAGVKAGPGARRRPQVAAGGEGHAAERSVRQLLRRQIARPVARVLLGELAHELQRHQRLRADEGADVVGPIPGPVRFLRLLEDALRLAHLHPNVVEIHQSPLMASAASTSNGIEYLRAWARLSSSSLRARRGLPNSRARRASCRSENGRAMAATRA